MTTLINPNNVFNNIFSSNLNKFGQANNSVLFESVAKVEITPQEQHIFDQIIAALDPDMDAYVAGGWVRDKIIGRQNKDIDIAVWSSVNTLNAANKVYENLIGQKSKEINVIGTTVVKIDGIDIEFTPFRKETYTDFSNKPIVEPGNLETETMRRDATLNSLLYNIKTGMILDYTGRGISDLKNGIIDTPQSPEKTFKEDPNRIMRVFRFMATLGFDAAPRVLETISQPDILALLDPRNRGIEKSETKMKKATPAEENYNQLKKMMVVDSSENILKALKAMVQTGAYEAVIGFPENFLPIDTPHQNKFHHLGIQDHMFEVLKNLDKDLPEDPDSRFILRMAALFHDVGKFDPEIRRPHPKNENQFMYPGHPRSSLDVAKKTFNKFIMVPNTPPDKLRERILRMVDLHDSLMDVKDLKPSHVYNIVQKTIGPQNRFPQDVDNLIRFFYADREAHKDPVTFDGVMKFEQYLDEMGEIAFNDLNNIVNGNDVLERITGGNDKSFIGKVLKETKDAFINGKIKNREEALLYLEELMRKYGLMKPFPKPISSEEIIERYSPFFGSKGPWIGNIIQKTIELSKMGKTNEEILQILDEEIKEKQDKNIEFNQ